MTPSRKPVRRHQGPRPSRQGVASDRLLHGLHAVRAAWLNPERTCRRLLATPAGLEGLADALAAAASRKLPRPAPETVDRAALDRMLGGAVHQGVALDAAPLQPMDLDDIGRAADGAASARVVVLDQVTDPHNVGAVLRSAAAFGALAVIVTERHAPEVTGTLAKAASGAVEHVGLVRVGNLAQALDRLRDWGFWTVGLAEDGDRTLADAAPTGRIALVLGAEGGGLRRLTRERCDLLVRLPTEGPIASLNVSNAAAVALYEMCRR